MKFASALVYHVGTSPNHVQAIFAGPVCPPIFIRCLQPASINLLSLKSIRGGAIPPPPPPTGKAFWGLSFMLTQRRRGPLCEGMHHSSSDRNGGRLAGNAGIADSCRIQMPRQPAQQSIEMNGLHVVARDSLLLFLNFITPPSAQRNSKTNCLGHAEQSLANLFADFCTT